jgi:hypothetical protein
MTVGQLKGNLFVEASSYEADDLQLKLSNSFNRCVEGVKSGRDRRLCR